jgi:hypothetical protein
LGLDDVQMDAVEESIANLGLDPIVVDDDNIFLSGREPRRSWHRRAALQQQVDSRSTKTNAHDKTGQALDDAAATSFAQLVLAAPSAARKPATTLASGLGGECLRDPVRIGRNLYMHLYHCVLTNPPTRGLAVELFGI